MFRWVLLATLIGMAAHTALAQQEGEEGSIPRTGKEWREYIERVRTERDATHDGLPGRYGIVALTNRTDRTITYQYTWGRDEPIRSGSVTLRPGRTHWHAWPYENGRRGHSPRFTVSFNWTKRQGQFAAPGMSRYALEKLQSP